jgi:hypothetical protein
MDLKKSPQERNRPISAISAAGDVLRVHASSQIERACEDFNDSLKSVESERLKVDKAV